MHLHLLNYQTPNSLQDDFLTLWQASGQEPYPTHRSVKLLLISTFPPEPCLPLTKAAIPTPDGDESHRLALATS